MEERTSPNIFIPKETLPYKPKFKKGLRVARKWTNKHTGVKVEVVAASYVLPENDIRMVYFNEVDGLKYSILLQDMMKDFDPLGKAVI